MVGVCCEELLAALVAIGDAAGAASGSGTHLQVVYGVAHHEGLAAFDAKAVHGFQREVGGRLGVQGFVFAVGMVQPSSP